MKELCVVVERAQLRAIVLGREPSTQSCIETPHDFSITPNPQRCAGGADLGDVHQERPCTWRSQRREGRLPHSNSGLHILDQDC
jgi:hypothetical protein